MRTNTCATCGSSFEQTTRGAPRQYCDACAPKKRKPVTHVPANKQRATSSNPVQGGVQIAATQGRRALLEALRNTIAQQIDDGVPARDLASLSKRLVDISDELDGLVRQQEGDDIAHATETPDEDWAPTGGVQTSTS